MVEQGCISKFQLVTKVDLKQLSNAENRRRHVTQSVVKDVETNVKIKQKTKQF